MDCDALMPGLTRTSIAVLFWGWRGSLVDGATRMEEVGSALQREAMAVRWTCLMAQSCNLSQVEIVDDNKDVIFLCIRK